MAYRWVLGSIPETNSNNAPPRTMTMHEEEGDNHRVSPILRAVILDLPSTVKHILAAGVDANTRYEYGNGNITALEAATLLEHVDVVRALVEHGVEVNGVGVGGRTALQNAVMHDRVCLDLIEVLLSAGADINARTAEGSTALHMAADRPGGVATILLQRGAAMNALDNEGCAPLHLAAQYGNLAATRALLAAGADATLRHYTGRMSIDKVSPLDVAARYGQVEVIRELARHGVDLDAAPFASECRGSLYHAASRNQVGAVDALVEAGASIIAQSSAGTGTTPLHSATTHVALEAVHALLRHGAPVLALPVLASEEGGTGRRNRSALHDAARMGGTERAARVVDLLLRWGADESELDSDGKTAAEQVGYYRKLFHTSTTLLCYPSFLSDLDPMYELLANAPADRVWRRRGLLLLCLARNRNITPMYKRRCGGGAKGAEEGALAKDGGGHGSGGGAVLSCADVEVSAATAVRCKRERSPSKLGGRWAKFGGVGGSGCNGDGSGGGLENGDDFDSVAALLREFEEEGFFRTIFGFL